MTAGPATPATDPAPDDATEKRRGILAGVAAYSLWGVFPLVFHQVREVAATEVLAHRIIWSFVVVVGVLFWRRDHTWTSVLRSHSVERSRLVAAAVLVSINWLVYVWAVSQARVVEAALGMGSHELYARYLVAGTTVDNDNLYIFGGSTGTTYLDEVWHYDRASATWTAKAPLPEPMGNLSVAYNPRDGMIYVAGG